MIQESPIACGHSAGRRSVDIEPVAQGERQTHPDVDEIVTGNLIVVGCQRAKVYPPARRDVKSTVRDLPAAESHQPHSVGQEVADLEVHQAAIVKDVEDPFCETVYIASLKNESRHAGMEDLRRNHARLELFQITA